MNFYEWFFLEKDRPPAGLFSWSHLLSVTIILGGLLVLGFFLAKKYGGNKKAERIIFIVAGAAIVTLYFAKLIFLLAISTNKGDTLVENLPLFFCDVMIIIIPIAAFAKGRIYDICVDFIAICGFLMGLMGCYFAGNIYNIRPAFCYQALINATSHSIAAFAAMFVFVARLNKMEKRNIPFVIGILFVLMSIALVVDYTTGKNFMFFLGGEGTPFDIFFNLVQGNLIAYQVIIYVLQCGYIGAFYLVYYLITRWIKNKKRKTDR